MGCGTTKHGVIIPDGASRCQNNHLLKLVKTVTKGDKDETYYCRVCFDKFKVTDGVYRCEYFDSYTYCHYAICPVDYGDQEDDYDNFKKLGQEKGPRCRFDHLLEVTKDYYQTMPSYTCNVCKVRKKIKDGLYHCRLDETYKCPDCVDREEAAKQDEGMGQQGKSQQFDNEEQGGLNLGFK